MTIPRSSFIPTRLAGAFTIAVSAFVFSAGVALACAWDRDTLAQELEGDLDVLDAIIMRFDVFPPRYYEMRVERSLAEVAADPLRLDLYDDIGVALDRLGRPTEAIEWMQKKREVITQNRFDSPTLFDHEYRYRANIGTFYAHRWYGAKAEQRDRADLEQARHFIKRAIQLNPNAHFGREIYQLAAIEWTLAISDARLSEVAFQLANDDVSSRVMQQIDVDAMPVWMSRADDIRDIWSVAVAMGADDTEEAIRGIAGLIQLGAARESVDVLNALSEVYYRRRDSSLVVLVDLRIHELLDRGARSIMSDANLRSTDNWFRVSDVPQIEMYFKQARAEADEWRAKRLAYLEAMFERGEHPDTHPDVWARAPDSDDARPEAPGHNIRDTYPSSHYIGTDRALFEILLWCMFLGVSAGCWGMWVRRRGRQNLAAWYDQGVDWSENDS